MSVHVLPLRLTCAKAEHEQEFPTTREGQWLEVERVKMILSKVHAGRKVGTVRGRSSKTRKATFRLFGTYDQRPMYWTAS